MSIDVVVIGGGLVGLSTAYNLLFYQNIASVTLIEKDNPMSLTSSASTGGHRIFFPAQDPLAALASRSSALYKELARRSNNVFEFNTRGYAFLTNNEEEFNRLKVIAGNASKQGGGDIRINDYTPSDAFNFENNPTGFDLVDNPSKIRSAFPFLTEEAKYLSHVRRAGFLNVEALGDYLLSEIKSKGANIIKGEADKISKQGSEWEIHVKNSEGLTSTLKSKSMILCLGPFLKKFVREQLGIVLPLLNEIHAKAVVQDPLGIFPETSPFMLWNVHTTPYWTEEERQKIESDEKTAWMAKPIPPADHLRPLSKKESDGKHTFAGIWTYDCPTVDDPVFPIPMDEHYGEIVFRGLVSFIPGFKQYFDDPKYSPKSMVEVKAGYYCKTPENMAIIGPLEEAPGIFICGGLSGYGIMQSQGAAELVSLHVFNYLAGASEEKKSLPEYSSSFHPSRYLSPEYLEKVRNSSSKTGQL